jgi:hypothetical protein
LNKIFRAFSLFIDNNVLGATANINGQYFPGLVALHIFLPLFKTAFSIFFSIFYCILHERDVFGNQAKQERAGRQEKEASI